MIDVCVVGGGPAGLALARSLAARTRLKVEVRNATQHALHVYRQVACWHIRITFQMHSLELSVLCLPLAA